MKKDNKKLQYTLIVLLVLIWGTVAFRMMNWNQPPSSSLHYLEPLPLVGITKVSADSFALKVNYRDPFLNLYGIPAIDRPDKPAKASKYRRKIPPTIRGRNKANEPSIQYLGYSVNGQKITRVRLSINEKNYTLQHLQQVAGVSLRLMERDSIIVTWKGEEKVIYRKRS